MLNKEMNTWENIELEVVLDSGTSFKPEFKMREDPVDNVLVSSPKERCNFRGVFWLFDFGVFKGILGISIVCVSPFILPTEIVGITVIVGDFIILDRVE